jgi:hypothetical protein
VIATETVPTVRARTIRAADKLPLTSMREKEIGELSRSDARH